MLWISAEVRKFRVVIQNTMASITNVENSLIR